VTSGGRSKLSCRRRAALKYWREIPKARFRGVQCHPGCELRLSPARIGMNSKPSMVAIPFNPKSTSERMYPSFTAAQIARLALQGHRRPTHRSEVLFEAGAPAAPFFVITQGQVEILRPAAGGGEAVTVLGPGQFTGEVNLLAGRRALVSARTIEAGEVIELERSQLLAVVLSDSEISEILMRAFILRRANLVARGLGDAVVIGSSYCAETLRVKEFLTRNIHPYTYIDLDSDSNVQELLDQFKVTAKDVPVLICRGEIVLRSPSNREIAECLGFNEALDASQVHDLVVVGAGPAGLAAAVYAASEGLDVLVIEANAPGGQAGSSSKIENYLGFPTGISGQALSARAFAQAQKFGAHILIAKSAVRLGCDTRPYAINIGDAAPIRTRAIVIATGADYHKPPLENLSRFEGVGVYYGATFMESQLCVNEDIIVVGGGNSAGQAAVYLAQTARHVHVLVRSKGLAETMSRYLVRRIEQHPGITLHTHTELIGLEGDTHLKRVQWRDNLSGETEARDIRHVFIMAGARPATEWLDGCLSLDAKKFIKTGPELSREELTAAEWPLQRAPYLLETSAPGVFAVGDVRAGNIKRVASAVGEGSIAVSFVHRVLET
jgi:thioredoxin reductase (NADPH)